MRADSAPDDVRLALTHLGTVLKRGAAIWIRPRPGHLGYTPRSFDALHSKAGPESAGNQVGHELSCDHFAEPLLFAGSQPPPVPFEGWGPLEGRHGLSVVVKVRKHVISGGEDPRQITRGDGFVNLTLAFLPFWCPEPSLVGRVALGVRLDFIARRLVCLPARYRAAR